MNNGFIVLWRKFMETSFFDDSYAVHLAILLLLKANHRDKTMIFNGETLVIHRGQVVTGRKSLVGDSKIKPSTIRNKLLLLKKVGFLDIKSNNKFSIITICKYNDYQHTKEDKGQQKGQPEDSQRTARGQLGNIKQDTNNNNNNNDNNDNNETIDSSACAPLSDLDFINTLKANLAYKHINLDNELAKMDAWLLIHHGRRKTRRFVVNWLNKIDKPMGIQARRP